MGAPGLRMVSQAFCTFTSWIALRDILLVVDLRPIVDTSLDDERLFPVSTLAMLIHIPNRRDTVLVARED